ncbi:MAG: methyltransferase domain-containing protein [Thermomicrobiales bacterium]
MTDRDHPADDATAAKARVLAQYGSVGDAYVRSTGFAVANDLSRMVELAQPLPTDRVLDIATGGGHVAVTFAPHVAQVIASDLTPEILHHAAAYFAERGLANVETALADAEDLPFADDSFQIVTCRIAPHHFPRPDRFVAEVARVLTPDGRFVLIDSTVDAGELGDFFNRMERLRDPSHVRALSNAEWEVLLAGAGLRVEVRESYRKHHDFDDWTARSRMAPEDKATLAQAILKAPAAWRDALQVETDADTHRLVGFSDTKTLFLARRHMA